MNMVGMAVGVVLVNMVVVMKALVAVVLVAIGESPHLDILVALVHMAEGLVGDMVGVA